ncbi:hypothetical protein BP00DRAFT_231443 [Aspergillus indologenus CBS 114.80]|uniref:Uncharacterized protein n=1 Tax=Aspergillus indologenus CBS 114.80 TaxID=1450541 RepID=A0A2V5IM88_9EURO|nr:hypothetical protein BP00DRAFT_231443 [Aspergillus indologenus CBS 114.80]
MSKRVGNQLLIASVPATVQVYFPPLDKAIYNESRFSNISTTQLSDRICASMIQVIPSIESLINSNVEQTLYERHQTLRRGHPSERRARPRLPSTSVQSRPLCYLLIIPFYFVSFSCLISLLYPSWAFCSLHSSVFVYLSSGDDNSTTNDLSSLTQLTARHMGGLPDGRWDSNKQG